MGTYTLGRFLAVLAGGATLFVLQTNYAQPLYVTLPAGIVVYALVRAGFGLWESRNKRAG